LEQTATLERLFERCKQGERRAQEQLYHHFASKMLGVCMRYAKSTFEAEDMLQAGFVKVFSAMQGFRGEGSLEGWIRRIIVNTAISTYRNNVRLNTEPWQETHDTAHAYELQHLECARCPTATASCLTCMRSKGIRTKKYRRSSKSAKGHQNHSCLEPENGYRTRC
jgi:RNA polymerase sigma factor (sigma-70 family)